MLVTHCECLILQATFCFKIIIAELTVHQNRPYCAFLAELATFSAGCMSTSLILEGEKNSQTYASIYLPHESLVSQKWKTSFQLAWSEMTLQLNMINRA